MILRRLKNLWKISAIDINDHMYTPKTKEEFVKDILKLRKQRLATVMQDEPLDVFEDDVVDNTIENDQTNK